MNDGTRACKIYVMVGTPASGKTTWGIKHLPWCYMVSRDDIRFHILNTRGGNYFAHEDEVFDKFVSVIAWCVDDNRYDCIADATHINEASRAKLFKALRQRIKGDYDIYLVCMDTVLAKCLKRNEQREGYANVPEDAIKRMSDRLTMPHMDEDEHIKGIWVVKE